MLAGNDDTDRAAVSVAERTGGEAVVPLHLATHYGVPKLIAIGMLAAGFFSATFVLNRALSLGGGHWYWSASLRYLWTLILVVGLIAVFRGGQRLGDVFKAFRANPWLWGMTGSVGYGVFYSGICYGAGHAPGWLVAVTWQSTIIISPVVLLAFGLKVRTPIFGLAVVIGAGIALAQLGNASLSFNDLPWLDGIVPILIAAATYPIGSQIISTARHGRIRSIPPTARKVLDDPLACVLLMTLGSLPWWIFATMIVIPPLPSADEFAATGIVALFSGVIGTGLFLWARNVRQDSVAIAAVDATQSMEVVFALLLEVFLLEAVWPGGLACVGLLIVVAGLLGFAWSNTRA